MNPSVLLEICVDSVESAAAAQSGGAHRVELCTSLPDGGLSPSSGLIATARQAVSIGLHVLIRPRSGDFCYSQVEFRAMQLDILTAKQLGADGVVLGILDVDGRVDVERTRQLVELAEPMRVTYNRAFDMASDLFQALDELQKVGVHSILTSGGEQTAAEGVGTLKRLVAAAGGRVGIIAAGGIEDGNVSTLIEQTGVRAIHASLKSPLLSPMRYQNRSLSMGTAQGREYQRFVVDRNKVEKLLRAASKGAPAG
ncbi:MAG: copper homeostasis protein CutC [Terriglobales bacterium]|jgi:copper homeostasis protein